MPSANRQTPYPLRMPEALRLQLEGAAATNGRSVNAEIVQRLQAQDAVTLRDHFAGLALQGLLASGGPIFKQDASGNVTALRGRAELPGLAYEYADEMLKARGLASDPAKSQPAAEPDPYGSYR